MSRPEPSDRRTVPRLGTTPGRATTREQRRRRRAAGDPVSLGRSAVAARGGVWLLRG